MRTGGQQFLRSLLTNPAACRFEVVICATCEFDPAGMPQRNQLTFLHVELYVKLVAKLLRAETKHNH